MTRLSAVVAGLEHGANPTPTASRVGPLVMTAAVQGWDRSTKTLPDELSREVELSFENLAAALDAVGAGMEDVVHINVFAATGEVRPFLNEEWRR
jgi:enamine deaminase RidA (YjgF/YER057c/UK114 family)